MKQKGFVDLNFVKLDIERERRRGFPEIIYAPGKTFSQLKRIIKEFKKHTRQVFISRFDLNQYKNLKKNFPDLRYFAKAKMGFLGKRKQGSKGNVLIVTAGTSDIAVAEEAALFLELTGNKVEKIFDVGAAGIHRLQPFQNKIKEAKVIIVVAGMEAALVSIVSGITCAPVIGIPTSVGYGSCFEGLSALLGMLNSCSLGVTVVNIDNGLGAGYFANLINV